MRARTLPSPRGLSLEYQPRNTRAEPERYRSGHNGADSKSDGRVIPARGFESHPLRQNKKGPVFRPFFILGVRGVWTNPPGFDKIAQRFWTTRTRRSGAKRRIRGAAANNPTLSATSFANHF